MSHAKELIERVCAELAIDYPFEAHSYVIEKMLAPGMMPDIVVMSLAGRVRCAVEIGYTRPEKLTAYRNELHIPDVRWYDRDGQLHLKWASLSPVHRNRFGTARVYVRKHNGCGFSDRYEQQCLCPKWIYLWVRNGKETHRSAKTSSFAEASEIAQDMLRSLDTGIGAPKAKSMLQALRWRRADARAAMEKLHETRELNPGVSVQGLIDRGLVKISDDGDLLLGPDRTAEAIP